ncbi:MAG TPA: DUF2089 domain-containing protein [Aquella sp.]|nr:DUF2089 domain-containing protein [Aquella sp.]
MIIKNVKILLLDKVLFNPSEVIVSKLISTCPSCGSNELHIVKIECGSCKTKFEGSFEIPGIAQLSDEDMLFILNFVKCSGSLKEMAKIHNISYPTFRNRLNNVIEKLNNIDNKTELNKNDILKLLEDGAISAKDAAKMLYEL